MKQQQTIAELFQADSDGLVIQEWRNTGRFWEVIDIDSHVVRTIKRMNAAGLLRIKPKTTYYRVYRDETGHNCIRSQSDSFVEWSAWQEKKFNGHLFIHLFDHQITE